MNRANNWDDFTAALSHLRTPMQNFVYADVDGHIGYFAPGAIPIRPRTDGTLPVAILSSERLTTSCVRDQPRSPVAGNGCIHISDRPACVDTSAKSSTKLGCASGPLAVYPKESRSTRITKVPMRDETSSKYDWSFP